MLKTTSFQRCDSRILVPGRCLWLGLLAVYCGLTVQAQVIDQISLDQISYDAVHSGAVPCSEYGHVSLMPLQSPGATQFLQVVGTLGTGPAWMVRNLPIVDSITETSATVDLTQLGVSRGTCINGSMFVYDFTLTDTPIGDAPDLTPRLTAMVGSRINRAEGDIPVAPIFPGSLAASAPPPAFTFLAGPLQFINRQGMGNVVQGPNECAPSAVANSMHWLESNGDIDLGGDTPDQSLGKLKSDMQPAGWTGNGVSQRETIEGKLRFAQRAEHPLNIDIHYQADSTLTDLGGSVTVGTMTANRDGTGGPPTLDYLLQEMKRGQDVEFSLDWLDDNGNKTGGHVIVVSGVLNMGSYSGIWFNDDTQQNGMPGGQRTDQFAKLEMEGNYLQIGGLTRNRVKAIYSESPIVLPTYVMIDLGTLGGPASVSTGINAVGQVCGLALRADFTTQAFIWDPQRGKQPLDGLGPGPTAALGLNSNGKVVGYWQSGTTQRPLVWTNGQPADVGGPNGLANGIDDFQEWIASTNSVGAAMHAFVNSGGKPMDLGTLGGQNSAAAAINYFGQVVGRSQIASGMDHAFVWDPLGGMRDLGTLPGLAQCAASGINKMSQVVGACYNNPQADPAGFVFHYGVLDPLTNTIGGQHSFANGINHLGYVVGAADNAMGLYRPVLWQGGQLIDLTQTILSGPGGCIFTNATAINDRGDIAGTALCLGSSHAVVLQRQ
jgi:probable HAF family extracellular repeat protein